MLSTHYQAYQSLRPLAVEVDLEKYYDIYEISQTDMDEAKEFASAEIIDTEEANSLTALKIALQRLHMIRKLFLCSLLALDADGGKSDFPRWAVATDTMRHISAETENVTRTIDEILREEESRLQNDVACFGVANHRIQGFPVPPTPQIPLTPGRQRMRSQIRKLSSLSQGIRGLQAKMHVLRDESDKLLENTDETAQSGPNLFLQYESIGEDLKSLLRDWEQGRVALVSNIDRSHNRRSSSLPGNADPPSPTPSLGGRTVVESSPTGPLHPYSGHGPTSRSRSSTTTSSSGEEVFEAVALPRQRSTLTREERLAKLKEERVRQAIVKGKADANTHMLKELEMVVDVIKDLVQDCNFDCNDSGIALQAMDNSHIALVSMMLKAESFSPFRCDRNLALGINLSSLMKVLRCAQNDDILTLKAEDAPDVVNLVFESSESDRLSEYDIKLMDIDQEHLGIPDTEYAATISMPSTELQRICKDLSALSESVQIEATKEGIKFSCTGDIGNGAVTLRSHTNIDKPDLNVEISLSEPVALTFSLKYLVNFCKASALSGSVKLCLSNEVPLLVEYELASNSYLRFYLAPKIGDEE
ncbi:hypothetical protein MMC22_001821 [Lobaria immixta]|nr:hypothetical protein [Lobaria immixta]